MSNSSPVVVFKVLNAIDKDACILLYFVAADLCILTFFQINFILALNFNVFCSITTPLLGKPGVPGTNDLEHAVKKLSILERQLKQAKATTSNTNQVCYDSKPGRQKETDFIELFQK